MVVPFSETENSEEKQNWKDRKEHKLDLTHDQIKYLQDTQAEKAGGNQIQKTRVQAQEKKKENKSSYERFGLEKENWKCNKINKKTVGKGADESFPRGRPTLLDQFRKGQASKVYGKIE